LVDLSKDFSFTSKYHKLNTVLQRIRELLFTNICKKRSCPVVCDNHVHLLQSSLNLEIDKITVTCSKFERDLENLDGLKDIRNLDIKETKGNRDI
jgi:hypothetical protein